MIDTSFVVADEDMHLFTINREIHIYISKDSHLNFEIQMSINQAAILQICNLTSSPLQVYNETTSQILPDKQYSILQAQS